MKLDMCRSKGVVRCFVCVIMKSIRAAAKTLTAPRRFALLPKKLFKAKKFGIEWGAGLAKFWNYKCGTG